MIAELVVLRLQPPSLIVTALDTAKLSELNDATPLLDVVASSSEYVTVLNFLQHQFASHTECYCSPNAVAVELLHR